MYLDLLNKKTTMSFKVFVVLVAFLFGVSYASECCDGYTDLTLTWHDPQWCSDYCCGTSDIALKCCSNILLQAPLEDRADYCVLWWKHHIWAPILIAVFWILVFICCCYCCYKCCCAPRNTTVLVQQPGGMMQPGITVQQISTSQQQQSTMNPMSYGYDQPKY